MANVTSNIAAFMKGQGSPSPVSLLEMQLISGARFYFSDKPINAPSLLSQFDTKQVVTPGTIGTTYSPNNFTDVGDFLTQNPTFAYDGNLSTSANLRPMRDGTYPDCIWSFASQAMTSPSTLVVLATYPDNDGELLVTVGSTRTFLPAMVTLDGSPSYYTFPLASGIDLDTVTVECAPGNGSTQIFEIYVTTGTHPITTIVDTGITNADFLASLIDAPAFPVTCDLVTQTATATIENLSGDTVNRTGTQMFTKQDLWGALFIFRIYDPALEYARFIQMGTVADADVDDTELTLDLSSWLNFSKITAPDCQINNNCQNVFRSQQCGSTSLTNCLNSYGNCSQLNRFKGLITQWNSGVFTVADNSGVAQPAPLLAFNARIPG